MNTPQQLMNAVAGVPEVFDTILSPVSADVAIRLKDGTPVIINVDRRAPILPTDPNPLQQPWPASPPPAPASRAGVQPLLAPAAPVVTHVLPGSTQFVPVDTNDFSLEAQTQTAAKFANSSYSVRRPPGPATLQQMTQIAAGAAVLWIATHGGYFRDIDGQWQYELGIEYFPAGAIPSFLDLAFEIGEVFAAPRRAVFVLHEDGTVSFGMTSAFIRKWWSSAPLAPNSVVFADACDSLEQVGLGLSAATGEESLASLILANQEFVRALQGTNAATVIGWYSSVYATFAEDAGRFLFDRILGFAEPLYDCGGECQLLPPPRPFSVPEVIDAMVRIGRDTDDTVPAKPPQPPEPPAQLKYVRKSPSVYSILLPSLRNMDVDEGDAILKLYGEFGTDTGMIEMTGADTGPKSWADATASAPVTPASSGLVRVKVGDLSSNAVPLTYWTGTFKGRDTLVAFSGLPGIWWEFDSNFHFRADVHPFRTAPELAAAPGTMPDQFGGICITDATGRCTIGGSVFVDVFDTPDSTCSMSCGGTGILTVPPPCTTTTTCVGSETLGWISPGTNATAGCNSHESLALPASGNPQAMATFGGGNLNGKAFTITEVTHCPDGTGSTVIGTGDFFEGQFGTPDNSFGANSGSTVGQYPVIQLDGSFGASESTQFDCTSAVDIAGTQQSCTFDLGWSPNAGTLPTPDTPG
jgi:hypothetical protein